MPGKTFISERADWVQDANWMMASASFHLVLLIGLGLLSSGGSSGGSGEKIVVSLGGGQSAVDTNPAPLEEELSLDAADVSKEAALDAGLDPAAIAPAAGAPQQGLADLATIASSVQASLGPGGAPAPALGGTKGSGLFGTAGPALGGGHGGEGTTVKASTEFFGIGGYGQSFVYVVDCSDSMNENGKFDRARYELLHSIEQLESDQRYFVIFYNQASHPMDGERPVQATKDHVAESTRWILDVEATGGTNPLPALLLALSMRPDAIYFLSDGQFDPATIQELRMRNRPNLRLRTQMIPIHTVAFVDRFAAGLMRTIARNSNGEFRFVK